VLPHAPVEGAAGCRRAEGAALLQSGAGAAAEIGRAADQVGDRRGDALQCDSRRLPGGRRSASGVGFGERLVPSGRELARHPLLQLAGERRMRRRIAREPLAPARFQLGSASHRSAPVGQRVLGDEEPGLLRPAEDLLGLPDLVCTERSAVRLRAVALGGRGIGDHRPERDQCRARAVAPGGLEGGLDSGQVVAVRDPEHPPAVGLEASGHIFAEGERGVAVDGDVVVVVEDGELAQPEMAGEGSRLAGDALHEISVAGEHPGPVVYDRVAGPVEVLGEEPLGDRHSNRVGESLSQRTGGGLDPRRVTPLGMSRRAGAPLAKVFDLVE